MNNTLRRVRIQLGSDPWDFSIARRETTHGFFHQFGSTTIPGTDGTPHNYLVAIVELDDGTVEMVSPYNIKFIK